jgi:signal transduction histidine kinase
MNTSTPTASDTKKARILVVDDITKNLQVVGTMLRNAGYEVMPTTSGAQALERVRAQLPDLILLDLMMPEMDGLEVCRRLKAGEATRQTPVIFLTASNEMEHLVQGFEVGAVDYVTKPFNPPELLARVQTHVQLRQARERLREMNDEKNEFMGIVAHDLRSPLGTIGGFAELLLAEPQMPRTEMEDFLRRIRDGATGMAEMVRNLLDANRIERGEMELKLAQTDLATLVASVVETHRPRAAVKNQAIHFDTVSEPLEILTDPNVTVQVIDNLVSNAVKYSPQGKNVFVRLDRTPEAVRCEVQDEGPGLSVEDQKKLFGKFSRLSAKPTGGEGSTGLGLSIVKKMVEAMKGKVWCESELGKGAKFVVQLPVA